MAAVRVRSKPDLATVFGLAIAAAGILGGLILEGGHIKDIAQLTAAFIVLGGTLGAVMVSTPLDTLKGAMKQFRHVLLDRDMSPELLIDEIVAYASKARKNGLVSLEKDVEKISDPFLHKAVSLAVDGADLQEIRGMMQLQIDIEEHRALAEARVIESAGGYSPTIGIIGAVLGLIQVMKNLANIDEVGHGIAVAFVATVYGVGLANIVLLPAANKMKARVRQETQRKELMVEGVAGIVEGLNPKLIRCKLEAYYLQETGAAAATPEATPEAAPGGEDREVGARAQKPRAAAVRGAV
jgi:chemotaxis protein MotA